MRHESSDDYEKIFYQDVREKKKAASGVYHRASRKGFIRGGVKTQSDFLSTKQKKLLNGEIKVSNKYDIIENLPTWTELMNMDDENKKNIFAIAKSKHSGTKLQKHWGISSGKLYGWYAKFELYVPKSQQQQPSKKTKSTKSTNIYKTIEDVPNYAEFLLMQENKKIAILTTVREEFSMSKLRKYWGISQMKLYNMFYKYNIIEKGDSSVNKTEKQLEVAIDANENNLNSYSIQQSEYNNESVSNTMIEEMKAMIASLQNQVDNLKSKKDTKGFKIEIAGIYGKEELESRLLNIAQITIEDKKYKINVSLEEV